MKSTLAWLTLSVALCSVSIGQTNSPENHEPFSIRITAPASVKLGDMIWVRATLTNISEHTISGSTVRAGGIDLAFDYDIREATGRPVERPGKQNLGKHIQSVLTRTLNPGESVEEDTLISRAFDMRVAGRYEVQLSRRVSDDPKSGIVKSNKVIIEVIP
jgi:hypothetical protein